MLSEIHRSLETLQHDVRKIDNVKFHEEPLSIWAQIITIIICVWIIIVIGRYLQRKKKKNPLEIKEGSSHPMEDMGNHPLSLPLHGDVSV
ncbi:hypothetical protein QE152_g4418 [Popillia japonica]|uniref:Uncharacterized protein n=1 Tax=Popillia japonica TaxID=7064 RepID=A0AAW1MW13_POPJA